MIADSSTNEKISNIISQRKTQIEGIMQDFHLNIFEGIRVKVIMIILKVK